MKCEFCGSDPYEIYLVPKQDGSLEVFSCFDCVVREGVYCFKHGQIHTGFSKIVPRQPSGTACLKCIEEDEVARSEEAEEIFKKIYGILPGPERERLEEWIEVMETLGAGPAEIAVLRAMLTLIHTKWVRDIETIIKKIKELQSVDLLLPWPF